MSKELAYVARELENSVFTSPRTMLTHARTFVEAILEKVLQEEKIPNASYLALVERIDMLQEQGLITREVLDALHTVRMNGNKAAHDVRPFRYSEALLSWEALYTIVSWYVEVYGPVDLKVPAYKDPEPNQKNIYDMVELQLRLENMEQLLTRSLEKLDHEGEDEAATTVEKSAEDVGIELPGMTTIRAITYKGEAIDIPYFLRDAFLLPQRFERSELFLIRLGAEEQARIMSELPAKLEGLHQYVKRYNETNDENFFEELKVFVEEEKKRCELVMERLGELFFFYKDDYIVVTESLANIPLNADEFKGIPSLLKQLNEVGIHVVGQLPRELVILAKYKNVGVGTVEKLFEQLRGK